MTQEVKCAWCSQQVKPVVKTIRRKSIEVIERACPACGKVLAAYPKNEPFLKLMSERVVSFPE